MWRLRRAFHQRYIATTLDVRAYGVASFLNEPKSDGNRRRRRNGKEGSGVGGWRKKRGREGGREGGRREGGEREEEGGHACHLPRTPLPTTRTTTLPTCPRTPTLHTRTTSTCHYLPAARTPPLHACTHYGTGGNSEVDINVYAGKGKYGMPLPAHTCTS